MNFIVVFKILIRILFISAVALAACIVIALIYNESIKPFVFSSAISAILAFFLFLFSRKKELKDLGKKNAYLTVSLAWIVISIIGALPYIFSGYLPSITDAFFESVSGYTTTGSSILTDIERLPKSILFWRSLTHWIGGIGIVVLVVVIMPSLKMGGYNLFTLESSVQGKILPRIKDIGYRLLLIYISLTVLETIFLLLGGMDLYESVCHSFGTVATGGFSPKNTSISGYSPYIQYVITIFMVLSGTNFIIFYLAFKRKFRKIQENEELYFYLGVIFISGAIVTSILFFMTQRSLELSFREAFFQVVSIITCTGYATTDYLLWPDIGWLFIFFLMFVGGSTGSTAGGIKMARHLVLIKNLKKIFHSLLHPYAVIPVRINKKNIHENQNDSILTFISWYFIAFLCGSLTLIILGLDVSTAMSSIATAMANIGPGIGSVGPVSNFAHLSSIAKLVISFFMILGRLEIYTLLILFTPFFWRK